VHASFLTIKTTYELYRKIGKEHGFKLYANRKLFNVILNDLKKSYPFLKEANSTVLQKAYDNLISAYKNGW